MHWNRFPQTIRSLFGRFGPIIHVNFQSPVASPTKMADIHFYHFSSAHLATERLDGASLKGLDIRVEIHR